MNELNNNFNVQNNNSNRKNNGPLIFGIIWIISCLSILFGIMNMKLGSSGYVFYIIIGFFFLIGIIIIVNSLKNKKNSNFDVSEPTDEEIVNETLSQIEDVRNYNPRVANALVNGRVVLGIGAGIKQFIGAAIAGIFALIMLFPVVLDILVFINVIEGDVKTFGFLENLFRFLLPIVVCILFIRDGIKKIKLSKKINDLSKDIN